MARRPQVKDLNTDTVVQPTATNLVDTYVKPAPVQKEASPLSQFVSAITPAVKAYTEKQEVARLKREREVETLEDLRKQKQIENQLFIGQTELKTSLSDDKEYWNSLTAEQANEQITGHFDRYIQKLEESGVDPLYIERAKIASENSATALFMTFDANKKAHQIKEENNEFIDVLSMLNATKVDFKDENKVNPVLSLIHKHINDSAAAFRTRDGKPDYKRFVDLAHKYMLDMSGDDADTLLYRALETLTKPDGSRANVMDTADRIKASSTVRARVAKERATLQVQRRKNAVIDDALARVFTNLDGTAITSLPSYLNNKGTQTFISKKEMETALVTDPRFLKMVKAKQHYDFLSRIGYTPEFMQNNFTNFVNLAKTIQSGEATKEDHLRLKAGFEAWEAMVNSRMDVSWINKDTMDIMKVMQAFVEGEATLATVNVPVVPLNATELDTESKTPVARYAVAAQRAFKIKPDDFKLTKEDLGTISNKLDTSLAFGMTPFYTSLSEAFNVNQVIVDTQKYARYLYSTGEYSSPDDAIDAAVSIIKKDYIITESSDGRYYAFKSYNTDPQKTGQIVDVINEANKSLFNLMKPWVNDNYSLQDAEEFDVAIYPHSSDPRALEVKLYIPNADDVMVMVDTPLTIDKKEFLTNPEYLNKLFTKTLEPRAPSVLDTTNENPDLTNIIRDVDAVNDASAVFKPYGESAVRRARFENRRLEEQRRAQQEAEAADETPVENAVLNETAEVATEIIEEVGEEVYRAWEDQEALEKETATTIPVEDKFAKASSPTPLGDIPNETTSLVEGVVKKALDVVIPSATADVLIKEEGYRAAPYNDRGTPAVGIGFQINSLAPDERALISDINNVSETEAKAVLDVKINKINDWWTKQVEGFSNLPDSSRIAAISMAYQLGKENVKSKWPKLMASIKEAGQYAEGSVEQAVALASAKFNMLYNVAEDGTVSATKWATQTAGRAKREAERMAAEAGEIITQAGEATGEALNAASSGFINAVIPQAKEADVGTAIVGKTPSIDTVVAIAGSKNPADVAIEYLGMDENTPEGANAVKGFFENIVGTWNPDNQSVEEFATSKAWCAAFLTQVLRDSGVDTTELIKGEKFNQIRAASYLKAGNAVEPLQAQPGDIMIKMHSKEERKKYKLGVAHVGIVAKIENDIVYFIGGNTGNKVELSDYNIKEKDVRFRRINGVTDLPIKSLPSLLELQAGKFARKTSSAVLKSFTSLFNTFFGD